MERGLLMASWCPAVVCASVFAASCNTKTEEVIGVVRSAADGCTETEVVYAIEVEDTDTPADTPPEWCALMGNDENVTCFLHSKNGEGRHGVELPRDLDHADVPTDHPDVDCWAAEAAAWDAEWDGTTEDYHPLWSNDWLSYE